MTQPVWLHARTGESWVVDTHDKWIAIPENQVEAGLPQHVRDAINMLPSNTSNYVDQVRILGCRGGLIRIRPYKNHISAQFYAPRGKVRNYLWRIYEFLSETDPYAQVHLGNLYNQDTTTVTMNDFGKRLRADETIMIESEISDIPQSRDLMECIESRLKGLK